MLGHLKSHRDGLLITIVGVLFLTPDALLLRLVEANHWTVLFWRSLFAGSSLMALSIVMQGRSFPILFSALSRPAIICAALFGASNIFFVISITHTKVANTLVILAAMPFIATVYFSIATRKMPTLKTLLPISIASFGIGIVFWGRINSANFYGDVFAFLSAIFMAATLVTVGFNKSVDTLTAIGLGSFFAAVFAFFCGAMPVSVSTSDLVYLFLDGGLVVPMGLGLITYGPKLISAPEVSLIMLLEPILGPLWVWWGLGEAPPFQTFVGGGLILGAVTLSAWLGLKTRRQGK